MTNNTVEINPESREEVLFVAWTLSSRKLPVYSKVLRDLFEAAYYMRRPEADRFYAVSATASIVYAIEELERLDEFRHHIELLRGAAKRLWRHGLGYTGKLPTSGYAVHDYKEPAPGAAPETTP